jgi:hypothetical protein
MPATAAKMAALPWRGSAIPSAGEELQLRLGFFRGLEADAYAEEADGAVGAAFPGVC